MQKSEKYLPLPIQLGRNDVVLRDDDQDDNYIIQITGVHDFAEIQFQKAQRRPGDLDVDLPKNQSVKWVVVRRENQEDIEDRETDSDENSNETFMEDQRIDDVVGFRIDDITDPVDNVARQDQIDEKDRPVYRQSH